MASSSSSNIQKIETTSLIATKMIEHFSHVHPLTLVQLRFDHINENHDKEDEYKDGDEDEDKEDEYKDGDEDEDEYKGKNDFVVEDHHVGTCKMCEEDIYLFHLCYYSCKDCDYSLHKFCAQLPTTQQNHPLHPGHNLTLSRGFHLDYPDYLQSNPTDFIDREWICSICDVRRNYFYNYHCFNCKFDMDIVCATMSEQKLDHPSHPHQLQRNISWMISVCYACGNKHGGTFYSCITCSWFKIHVDCVLLPAKLLIQQYTNDNFSHSHLLTLAYSFPYIDYKAKFFPNCRVCEKYFLFCKWHYRCDKCRYYVHVDCATSRHEAFMSSILMPAGFGKTSKNFKDDDHPNLISCPFPDESVNLLKHHFDNKGKLIMKGKIDGEMFGHSHPLILFDTLNKGSVSLQDPMKKVELLCDGCVRPIMDVPFYKCSHHSCNFVLHEWCTRLPSKIQDHHAHPYHTLFLMPKIPTDYLGLFWCKICRLPCNGFAYGCLQCQFYVDINCGFIPDIITHEAHPNHLLLRFESTKNLGSVCKACDWFIEHRWGFRCPICDFSLHTKCALLLPKTIKHKCDKHPLILRYYPVENHSSEYFCDICEDEFNPMEWFYHCSMCDSSMHTTCAPLKLQFERSTRSKYDDSIFRYINVKFGGTVETEYHMHPLTFVQGINIDGQCDVCVKQLQYDMILKCFKCRFALHYWCLEGIRDA